jgi:hypothetical protein
LVQKSWAQRALRGGKLNDRGITTPEFDKTGIQY